LRKNYYYYYYYVKVILAHSYNENRHERANENNNALIYTPVFSWRRNDMAVSSSLWNGAGSAFHVDGPSTAKLRGP